MPIKRLLNGSWFCISSPSPSKTCQDLKENPVCDSSPLLFYHSLPFQSDKRISEWFAAMKGPLGPWFLSSFWGVAWALGSTLGIMKEFAVAVVGREWSLSASKFWEWGYWCRESSSVWRQGWGWRQWGAMRGGRGEEGRRERGREEKRLAFLASGYSLLVGWHVWGLKPMIPAPWTIFLKWKRGESIYRWVELIIIRKFWQFY